MDKLLKLLNENARRSAEELGTLLAQSTGEIAAKIDEYVKKGVILGYKTVIDWDKAGSDRVKCIIDLKVTPQKGRGFDDIAEEIARMENVESVLLMSGGYDLSVVVTGKSFQDIALFVARQLSPMDGVLSTTTHFVLKTYKKDGVLFGMKDKDERGYASL
ncbi:MAG: Lrp/AsnC family transcriptional regulator [Oscillospiraceae bacterium]|nr:Lrp/AsnC family transcriptional regulator [Oscillospiraceae bacterium]